MRQRKGVPRCRARYGIDVAVLGVASEVDDVEDVLEAVDGAMKFHEQALQANEQRVSLQSGRCGLD